MKIFNQKTSNVPGCEAVAEEDRYSCIDHAATQNRAPRRVHGWISIEVGVAIAFVAIMLFFLGPRIPEMFASGRTEQAFTEVNDLILAAERYRSVNGNYASISIFELGSKGYGFSQQINTNGGNVAAAGTAGDNVYGLAMQVAAASPNTDGTITYTFTDPEPCQQVLARIENYPQVKGTPACASSTNILTITIE